MILQLGLDRIPLPLHLLNYMILIGKHGLQPPHLDEQALPNLGGQLDVVVAVLGIVASATRRRGVDGRRRGRGGEGLR